MVLKRHARRGIAATRMTHEVHRRQLQCADERRGVAHDRRHRVVVVLRVVGLALPQLVEGDGTEVLGERPQVQVPGVGARGRVTRAEIAAVDKDDRLPRANLEIARADAVDIEPATLGKLRHRYFAVTASSAGTPSVRQSVLFGTMPSNEASFACGTLLVVPSAGPPSLNFLAAATIMRRNCTTAMSLEPG